MEKLEEAFVEFDRVFKRGGLSMGRGRARVIRIMAEAIMEPTAEQAGAFILSDVLDRDGPTARRLGKAYRRRRMIDILFEHGILTIPEFKALHHYRHHADIADQSPIRDSLARGLPAGGGDGPTVTVMNAIRVRDDCERAAGSLRGILRAVVVDDMSLSKWAMTQFGARDVCKDRKGKRYCWIEARPGTTKLAEQEIRMAAECVRSELDARLC